MLPACQCSSEDQDPNGNSTGDATRFWKGPAGTIAAFVIPIPGCLMSAGCWSQVRDTRDFIVSRHKLQKPILIVGFNYMDADAPFKVCDAHMS